MAEDLLSLKWNNHKPAFFHLLKTLREKGRHTDVTLTCGSQFFPAHRLVLVACSQFFSEVLEHTGCGRPVIVLKDVCAGEMEALLDYMYLGEVDVPQASLPGLIRAAESLKIKGLAVPDTDPNITTAATPTPITTTTTTAATTTGNGSTGCITTPVEDGNQEPPPPTTTTTTTTTDDLHTTETQGRPTKRRKVTESHSDHDLTSELQVQITEVKTEAVELSETTFDPSDLEMVPGQGQLQHFLSEEEGHAFEVMAGMSGVHGEGHDGSTNESTTLFPSSHLIGPQIQEDSQLNEGGQNPSKPTTGVSSSRYHHHHQIFPPGMGTHHHHHTPTTATTGGYHCPHCFKRFTDKYKRDRHLLIHTGEKPFKCPMCDYRSSRKDPVIRHVKFKHSNLSVLLSGGAAGDGSDGGVS